MIDDKVVAQDYAGYDLFEGQEVWRDPDGNLINEDEVSPDFANYLEFMGANRIMLGEM